MYLTLLYVCNFKSVLKLKDRMSLRTEVTKLRKLRFLYFFLLVDVRIRIQGRTQDPYKQLDGIPKILRFYEFGSRTPFESLHQSLFSACLCLNNGTLPDIVIRGWLGSSGPRCRRLRLRLRGGRRRGRNRFCGRWGRSRGGLLSGSRRLLTLSGNFACTVHFFTSKSKLLSYNEIKQPKTMGNWIRDSVT